MDYLKCIFSKTKRRICFFQRSHFFVEKYLTPEWQFVKLFLFLNKFDIKLNMSLRKERIDIIPKKKFFTS